MHVEFYGAAGEVTGSLHRVHVNGIDVVLDCGLFQGRRAEANRINRELPRWALDAHAVVLSHAHLDHSGNLPTLVKRGFVGNIYCTPPTRDLCSVMLRDAAMIQEQDARFLTKKYAREGSDERIDPLYTTEDAQQATMQMISVPLHRPMKIAPGVELTFSDAGHVLGSALVQLDLVERGKRKRLLFTGDLGRSELPLLENPERVDDIDILLVESTYGDRSHGSIAEVDDTLLEIVETTLRRKGRVYIPTFALERAQEVLFTLERLHERGKLPQVPIYIDSPLAIAITEIYKLHPEGLDAEVRRRILERDDPFAPPGLQYVSDVASSKRLQASGEPCIVLAGSGMCEGGRILHHFTTGLADPNNTVVIVGFMAQHTLGRRLVERRKQVKVFGLERDVKADIRVLNGLSAHADRHGLVAFIRETARRGRLERIALVHGEPPARAALAEALRDLGLPPVLQPVRGDRLDF
jgi:metallo-beta-lactamase family protein